MPQHSSPCSETDDADRRAEPHRRRCRLSWRGLTRVTGRGRPDAKQHSDILKMQADTACSATGQAGTACRCCSCMQ